MKAKVKTNAWEKGIIHQLKYALQIQKMRCLKFKSNQT